MNAQRSRRTGIQRVSDEMKAWSAALANEILDWPQVQTRSFFGFTGIYRRDRIFALLPRTRAMGTPNSVALKLEITAPRLRARLDRDPRFAVTQMRAARWHTFELSSDSDLHDALDWLGRAYDAAGKKKKSN